MKKMLTTIALLVSVTSHPSLTTAGTTELTPINQFELLDSNKDGSISVEEATSDSNLVNAFTVIDTNGDSKLTQEEYDMYVANTVKKSG